jgi:hypothetical protein
MNTIKTAAASVIGARHTRAARNGQDAVATWSAGAVVRRETGFVVPAAVVVVCDGCSSGARSEVGAQLGANLFTRALAAKLESGASPCDPAMWADARAEVVAQLGALGDELAGSDDDFVDVVRDQFLFTVVAAAVRGDEAAVWAVGDGVYSFGDYTRELGPFADNAPPYLGYDLLGDARPAHFEVLCTRGDRGAMSRTIVIGTDGAGEIVGGIERFAGRRYVEHPDVLRRELSVLAKTQERIDWDERRVIRTPAMVQDDCAIAVLRWEPDHLTTSESLVSVEVTS